MLKLGDLIDGSKKADLVGNMREKMFDVNTSWTRRDSSPRSASRPSLIVHTIIADQLACNVGKKSVKTTPPG
jgi:hypothetical protein